MELFGRQGSSSSSICLCFWVFHSMLDMRVAHSTSVSSHVVRLGPYGLRLWSTGQSCGVQHARGLSLVCLNSFLGLCMRHIQCSFDLADLLFSDPGRTWLVKGCMVTFAVHTLWRSVSLWLTMLQQTTLGTCLPCFAARPWWYAFVTAEASQWAWSVLNNEGNHATITWKLVFCPLSLSVCL